MTDSLAWRTARLFTEHVSQSLASATRNRESRAILVMDLDGFKWVNDTFGHDQGDCLLKQVTDRLVAATREADTIARLGGDEFAILPGRRRRPAGSRRNGQETSTRVRVRV